MRAFASGLGASSDQTPVRLLHLSPKAVELLRAYRHDPSWSKEALLAIEEGGIAAASLVGWATELERVYREQPSVRGFLRFVGRQGVLYMGVIEVHSGRYTTVKLCIRLCQLRVGGIKVMERYSMSPWIRKRS